MKHRSSPFALTLGSLILIALAGCQSAPTVNDGRTPTSDLPRINPSAGDKVVAKKDPAEVARINIELASQYFGYGQPETANTIIKRALEADPRNIEALTLAGFIEADLKNNAGAQKHFDEAMQIAPMDPDVLHNYATFLCRTGRPQASIPYFDRALSIDTYRRPAASLAGAGSCLVRMGDDTKAAVRFSEALGLDPYNPQALFGSAEMAVRQGRWSGARDFLGRYHRISPATAETLWMTVQSARGLGEVDDARMAATDLRSRFPDSAQTRRLNAQ